MKPIHVPAPRRAPRLPRNHFALRPGVSVAKRLGYPLAVALAIALYVLWLQWPQ